MTTLLRPVRIGICFGDVYTKPLLDSIWQLFPLNDPSENLALILRYVFFFTYVRDMSEVKLHPPRRGGCKRESRESHVCPPDTGGLSGWSFSLDSITAIGRILKEPSTFMPSEVCKWGVARVSPALTSL